MIPFLIQIFIYHKILFHVVGSRFPFSGRRYDLKKKLEEGFEW